MMIKEFRKHNYKLMQAIDRDSNGNPLTLEGAIRSMILKHPNITQYRDDALSTLYCVLGAGIDWNEAGRLGDSSPNNYMNMPPDNWSCGATEWPEFGMDDSLGRMLGKDSPLYEEMRSNLEVKYLSDIRAAETTVLDIDKRCQTYRTVKWWYPFSWFGSNLCAPENAQEDFFMGALETIELIRKFDPQHGTERWIQHQRTKRYANEVRDVLLAKHKQDR